MHERLSQQVQFTEWYLLGIHFMLCSQATVFAPPRCVIKNIDNCIKPNTTASRIMGFQDFKCLDEKISASRKECQEESFFDWEIQEDLLETGSCFLLRRPISSEHCLDEGATSRFPFLHIKCSYRAFCKSIF